MSTTPHDDDDLRAPAAPSHLGRGLALGLAVLALIPSGWLSVMSLAFWSEEEPGIGFEGIGFEGIGATSLVVAVLCVATIVVTVRSMARD